MNSRNCTATKTADETADGPNPNAAALSPSGMQRLWRRVQTYADRCTECHRKWWEAKTDEEIEAYAAKGERAWIRFRLASKVLRRREQEAVIAAYELH